MRFLWVEDFGEDSEDQEDKKELWMKYFSIEDNILFCTLEDALSFLDNSENKKEFDIVLLDIRFPVLSDESKIDEDKMYKLYFSSFITEDIFKKYAYSEEMKDASSGILLFLALVFRYGYNWNNIAFISANIDNEDLSAITTLKEIITKVKYREKLTSYDMALYETIYHDLFLDDDSCIDNKMKNQCNLKILTYEEIVSEKDSNKLSEEIQKLNTFQEMLNQKNSGGSQSGLKYCSVRNQFKQIGLNMPPAFEKPINENQNTCWLFKEWIESKADETTCIKRSIITIVTLLHDNISGNVKSFLNKQRKYNDGESTMTEDTLKQYFHNILRSTTNFSEIRNQDNEETYATNIIETVVSVWENIKKPCVKNEEKDTYYEFAYYSVMKITRNWLVHQGISGINIRFAAFVFVVSVKGILEREKMPLEVQNLLNKEMQQIIDKIGIKPVVYGKLNIDELMEKEYEDMKKRVQRAIPNDAKHMRIPKEIDPFSLISALGHEESCSRKSVSVNEIYKLFWLSIYFGDSGSSVLNPDKNKDRELINILENVYTYQT